MSKSNLRATRRARTRDASSSTSSSSHKAIAKKSQVPGPLGEIAAGFTGSFKLAGDAVRAVALVGGRFIRNADEDERRSVGAS